METLQEIKNNYAKGQGYEDWEEYFMSHFATSSFSMTATLTVFEKIMNEICICAQKAALKKAAEKLPTSKIIESNGEEGGLRDGELQLFWEGAVWMKNTVTKSITNPENLIR